MIATLRSFFLTRRFFGIGWGIVALFVAAYFLPPLLPVALAAAALLVVAALLDAVRLYRVKEGIQASRQTLAK